MRNAQGLNQHTHQGYYGEAFVRVLAASAGLIVSRADLDVTGEDFSIGYPGTRGSLRHARIEVQVKSWSKPGGSLATWRYPMRAEHFNELAGTMFYLPRYLFLVIVPDDAGRYSHATDQGLRLHRAGYWASFANDQPVTGARTITVDIPKKNLLTATSIRALIPTTRTAPGQRHPS